MNFIILVKRTEMQKKDFYICITHITLSIMSSEIVPRFAILREEKKSRLAECRDWKKVKLLTVRCERYCWQLLPILPISSFDVWSPVWWSNNAKRLKWKLSFGIIEFDLPMPITFHCLLIQSLLCVWLACYYCESSRCYRGMGKFGHREAIIMVPPVISTSTGFRVDVSLDWVIDDKYEIASKTYHKVVRTGGCQNCPNDMVIDVKYFGGDFWI